MAYASLRLQIEIVAATARNEGSFLNSMSSYFSLCTSEMDTPYPLAPINIKYPKMINMVSP